MNEIISAVVKSGVGVTIGNALVDKVIDLSIDGVLGKFMKETNRFFNSEALKIEHIFSKENMISLHIADENIDYVTAEIKQFLSWIDITDEMFRICRYDIEKISSYLLNKYCTIKDNKIECESDIKKCLHAVAGVVLSLKFESDAFKDNLLLQVHNISSDTYCKIEEIYGLLKENFNEIDKRQETIIILLYEMLRQDLHYRQYSKNYVKSRTMQYAQNWKDNMFLNNLDERDEIDGDNVKLRDIYAEDLLPHYRLKEEDEVYRDLKIKLSECVHMEGSNKSEMLLILGQPGIGKSTLITWIIANLVSDINDVLVYQFATDLKNINWESTEIFEDILNELNLSYDDLQYKTLILDGFDEIDMNNTRYPILNQLYNKIKDDSVWYRYSIIITCRENYIQDLQYVQCKYITLQTWDQEQIASFCNIFQGRINHKLSEHTLDNIIKNKNVFGIPLILYMVMALNIEIMDEESIVDVYEKIFVINGGIYDRCIDKVSYGRTHRTSPIKKEIHQVSREIAIWMFENNPDEANIPQKEYEKICNIVQKETERKEKIKEDTKVGTFFQKVKHCDEINTDTLRFVHRSIYEYFVAETIFNSIEDYIMDFSEDSREKVAKNFVTYFQRGYITHIIGEYLKHKILRYCKSSGNKEFIDWWESILQIMLKNGRIYCSDALYDNIVQRLNCFRNVMHLASLLLEIYPSDRYIMETKDLFDIQIYLRLIDIGNMNEEFKSGQFIFHRVYLGKADLSHVRCNNVDFSGSNFLKAYMERIDFYRSNLHGTNLYGARLKESILSETDLGEADLRETILESANLDRANLNKSRMEKANLDGASLIGTVLNDANLNEATLRRVNLEKASLHGAKLKAANLNGANLRKADLRNADLSCAYLCNADLYEAKLANGILEKAHLENADLQSADLSYAYLCGAALNGAKLKNAILNEANLQEANLQEADLQNIDFGNANLTRAIFEKTNLKGTSLKGANINESKWSEDDIKNVYLQLREAVFEYIKVKSSFGYKMIYRKDINHVTDSKF